MLFKFIKQFSKGLLVAIGVFVFIFYLFFLFKPYCLKLGYTLCAAVGEDFFALYQATYNFFHNIFIYGLPATVNLVAPYFVIFKYFPASPLFLGWPFLIFAQSAENAYQLYLTFNLIAYVLAFLGVQWVAKKFATDNFTKIILFVIWFTYFPILSDLRMGQYNLISSLFLFVSLMGIIGKKPLLSALSWLISLLYKPLALLNGFYFFKTKNKIALWGFMIIFVVFTAGYLGYYNLYYPQAISDFLKLVLLSGDRSGWQIHYPDNFSVNAFLGELFYDSHRLLFSFVSKLYPLILIGIFLVISYKIQFKGEVKTDLYYSLYAFSTLMMLHKEVWESWLSAWLIVLVVLIILASRRKEKIFLILNSILLGTPTLFYFYEVKKTKVWLTLLIAEKVIPQILIYSYLVYLMFAIIREQKDNENFALYSIFPARK